MKNTFYLTVITILISLPIVVWAVETSPPEKFAEAHADVTVWVFGLLLGALIFLCYRMINQNDKNYEQNKIEHAEMIAAMKEDSEKKWSAIGDLSQRLGATAEALNHLRGEHDVLKGVHLHKRAED